MQGDVEVVGQDDGAGQFSFLGGGEEADGAPEQVGRNGDDVVQGDGTLVIEPVGPPGFPAAKQTAVLPHRIRLLTGLDIPTNPPRGEDHPGVRA